MNTRSNSLRSVLAAAALVPIAASANPAVTTQAVNMRAGPDPSYPLVATLGPGFNVDVVGCADGWQWCDVVAGPNRGWVSAGYLSYAYYDRPTLIAYGGPTLGIPLVSFSIGNYWDNYYRARPFWNNRAYWYNHRVASTPQWHGSSNGHWNDWRYGNNNNNNHNARGNNKWNANAGRGHDNGRGNDWRGNNDRRAASDHREAPQHWVNPDHFPMNDQFNPNAQQ